MAASDAVILKNDIDLLPVTAPASLLLTGNHPLDGWRMTLAQHWPSSTLHIPDTRHPVRLQTLARREPLVLLSIVLPVLDKPVLPRREQELIDKVASLRQTILLLSSPAPIAMLPWHEQVRSLLWLAPAASAAEVLTVLSGSEPGGVLSFDLPRYPGNLQRQPDGSFVQRADIRPAFAKGRPDRIRT